ncbi:MAG: hypothetical protein AB7F59_03085 [Bdellovibrionales bacterium]
MKFPFPPEERLQEFEKKLVSSLGIQPGTSVETLRAYPDLSTGLNEIARGLIRMYPHKRKFAYLRGAGLNFDPIVQSLSIEGVQGEPLDVKDIGNMDDWLSKLSKDCLLFLDVIDDPMTGEIFGLEKLRAELANKKIFTLSVFHGIHLCREVPPIHQFAAYFMNVSDRISVARLGAKCSRLPPMIAGLSEWVRALDLEKLELYSKVTENKKLVEDFESKKLAGSKPFFTSGKSRLFDRAAIVFEDVDGEAFIQELAQHLKIKLLPPGQEKRLETTSGCRWGGFEFFKYYESQGLPPETLRGLVLISLELLNPDLEKHLLTAHAQLLKLQNGE